MKRTQKNSEAPSLAEELTLTHVPAISTEGTTLTVHGNGSVAAPLGEKDPRQIGRYRVEGILGQGGFGCVYLSRDEELNRPVAIKVPRTERVGDSSDVEDFLLEARIVARLDHPNISPVYDVGRTEDGKCFVVSKLIEGVSLKRRLDGRPWPATAAAELLAQVADALHYAHTQGLTHRDIKPDNILLDAMGQPHVVDFGLARRDDEFDAATAMAGTPAYMSPEQARGHGDRVDGRLDIFSLGVVLYELLVGRRPFQGASYESLREQIVGHDPKPPRQLNDRIPDEVERICLRALAKSPADRYTTAKDMAQDLRGFVHREALAATFRSDSRKHVSPAPSKRRWQTIVAVLAIAAGIAVLWFGFGPPREANDASSSQANAAPEPPEVSKPAESAAPVPASAAVASLPEPPKVEEQVDSAPKEENEKPPEAKPAPRETLEEALALLKSQGKDQLRAQWLGFIEQKKVFAKQPTLLGMGKVIAGRVLPEGGADPRQILAQMQILEDGYFATLAVDSTRPLAFRMHGYEPLDVPLPTLSETEVTYLGTIHLPKLAPARQATLQGQVALESGADANAVEVLGQIYIESIQPSNALDVRPQADWPKMVTVRVSPNGKFLQSGFTPGRYSMMFRAPGHVDQSRFVTFTAGEVANLGVVAFESPVRLRVEYYTSPTGDFTAAEKKADTVVPGATSGEWKSNKATPGYELRFQQQNGELFFGQYYLGTTMVHLGKKPLDEYRNVDLASQRMFSAQGVSILDGGVYLLHVQITNTLEYWTLLRVAHERPKR